MTQLYATCRFCECPIAFDPESERWYHDITNSTYCDDDTSDEAFPQGV